MSPWSLHLVTRPLVGVWLAVSPHSWRGRFSAHDSPHVHAPGTDPDRLLLTGDGVATGRGVATGDLGLPGHLARSLSAHTGHATDVDMVVDERMTARSCSTAIAGVDLFRFDVILLSVGANEALALKTVASWRNELDTLLSELEGKKPSSTRVFILAIPVFGPRTRLPARLANVVDRHAHRLNGVTADLVTLRSEVTLIPLTDDEVEPGTRHVYRRWADSVASRISEGFDGGPHGDEDHRPG